MRTNRLISIIDDDESVRESLESLLRSIGFRVLAFGSAEDFLAAAPLDDTDCIILDVRLGGASGPDLQKKLKESSKSPPIIFITAHGSETLRARVLADGAVDFLIKPFSEEKLLAAVEAAVGPLDPPIKNSNLA